MVDARRRRWVPIAITAIALVGLLGTGVLGTLLYVEMDRHSQTRKALRETRADVTRLDRVRRDLEGELERTRSLATRRGLLLRRARSVLRGVDPVLTSVDELQSITADIQEARDVFASDSSELVDDLIDLGNYLIDTPSYAIDSSYVGSLIDQINAEIDAVRSDSYSLDTYDGNHERASRRFDTRASAFVNAVRGLERQLKQVSNQDGS